MKKLMLILLVSGFLLACNSQTDKSGETELKPKEESHQDQEKKSEGLVLNNGAKWKADPVTIGNVALIQNIVAGAKKGSIDDYSQTATQLQDALNKMISECKMRGPDHDALHQWLEPLIEKTKDLKSETSIEKAGSGLNEIDSQLKLFAQYFEK